MSCFSSRYTTAYCVRQLVGQVALHPPGNDHAELCESHAGQHFRVNPQCFGYQGGHIWNAAAWCSVQQCQDDVDPHQQHSICRMSISKGATNAHRSSCWYVPITLLQLLKLSNMHLMHICMMLISAMVSMHLCYCLRCWHFHESLS